MASDTGSDLIQVVALLGAGVIAVPIFKRLGLGSVLGYLTAGVLIGPFAIGLFKEPEAILHVAELGVVMFLFIIGLEMQPSRLWGLRRDIFGLGVTQVFGCGALLTGVGIAAGLRWEVAFIAAMGFVLSSTAVIMQMMDERGESSTPGGQRNVAILLLEDLAIVPLLAVVALLAPVQAQDSNPWIDAGIAVGAVVAVVAVGLYLLNPMFRLLAAAKAREVMTAAALLVVLGTALVMDLSGLSMAMGAFLAGVLLSESTFRHQLEADIEPFRGILLGLFFLSVGMSLDLSVLQAEWRIIAVAVLAYMAVKSAAIYVIARLLKTRHPEALTRAFLFAQGGEFAFVLYGAATSAGIISGAQNAIFTATVILSMALTPLLALSLKFLISKPKPSMDGVDKADDLHGSVLIIGYGRFGQIVSQPLLARGFDLSIIDNDTELIRQAYDFGFKVYYGDGTRLDILHAAGAQHARVIVVCTDKPGATSRIVEIIKAEFPLAEVFARAYDREHALELVQAGVDAQMRETFHSALAFGQEVLVHLGVEVEVAAAVAEEVRRRDAERFEMQIGGGIYAGRDLVRRNLDETKPTIAADRDKSILPTAPPTIDEQELEDLVDETSS
jgi:glutathione-regulated potassium-efflux system protein KefB